MAQSHWLGEMVPQDGCSQLLLYLCANVRTLEYAGPVTTLANGMWYN